ncbi:MAG: glycoside hydrolase family 3 N-terminal domain-containing protein [Bacteroidota bacterium]
MRALVILSFVLFFTNTFSQDRDQKARAWADSVLQSLTQDQKIAQLMIIRAHSNLGQDHVKKVTSLIKQYNVGGLCFFQGGPLRQALLTNQYQQLAQTPLMITIDGEWGLGMRLDSVQSLPRQLMLGSVQDPQWAYRYGKVLGQQCKRMGIQVNYAPVVDVNNNPANPVINDRSLGEDREKVAAFGVQVVKGMQDEGVMACAKHFPGHGDTETDSHYDLPVIRKSRKQLDSLELYPFRELFKNNVGSVMVGHLFIPSIDGRPNRPTSLSAANVTTLMRQELNYMGLAFTDAMEMKGVTKFFPSSQANVEALIAGNDMLCLPDDVPGAIHVIKKAIRSKVLSWDLIDARVRRVLEAKYMYGLASLQPIDTTGLIQDLNTPVNGMIAELAAHGITLLKNEGGLLPLNKSTLSFLAKSGNKSLRVAYVAIGIDTANAIAKRMQKEYEADLFFFNYKRDAGNVLSQSELIKRNYDYIIVGVHNYSRRPAKNFGISDPARDFVKRLMESPNSTLLMFGNPYATKNFCDAKRLMICYEDHPLIQEAAFEILTGQKNPEGKLPVTICESFPFGSGISYPASAILPKSYLPDLLFTSVDSIIHSAIKKRAMPGCVVLAAKEGKIFFEKAYGTMTYDNDQPITTSSVFDMASVTKICATTLAVMKLYDEGKIDLKKKIKEYLPWVNSGNKGNLTLKELLLHEGGLKAWIPFHHYVTDTIRKEVQTGYFSNQSRDGYRLQVAENMFVRNSWTDAMFSYILHSETSEKGKYVYSDNDFIFLGKIVEQITGMDLDAYVRKTFYEPLNLHATGFLPLRCISANDVVPTENDTYFRKQLLRGYVHDQTAALFGGISGHAGLFSTAYETAVLMQMLLNGGKIGNLEFIRKETVELFTSYQSNVSRRGLGFDKPEKDNKTRTEPYPSSYMSSSTFGHTGFTGTATWADPDNGIVVVFLSNRVHPDMNNGLLSSLAVRRNVIDELYRVAVK